MCILTASAIEVKSHQRVMITVSKEAKFKKIKIWIFFLLFWESARKSGARKNFSERDRERRSLFRQ